MFKSNNETQYVPSKVISIKPEAQIDYNPVNQNQIRFHIPQYIGFFDPRGTMLKYKFSMEGRGIHKPDPKAGTHSLYRDLRVRDGSASSELEMVQDYNVLTSQWWDYTANESINHKRDLFEGRSANQDINNQLLYGPTPDWSVGTTTTSPVKKTIEIEQPIYSGILGGDKVFPVIATKGIRFEMTLDNLRRSIVVNNNNGFETTFFQASSTKSLADDTKTANDSTFSVVIKAPADAPVKRGVNKKNEPVNNNTFDIGDVLYISDETDGGNEEQLGVITSFKSNTDNLEVVYIPNRPVGDGLSSAHAANSRVFIKIEDRINGISLANVPATSIAQANTKINYKISDIELLLLQVQPPTGYVQSLMKQVASSGGLSMDYRTWSLYRFNLTQKTGLTNQLIPATQQRAYSILSVPLSVDNQNKMESSSFKGVIDGTQNYQYVFGGSLIPDRPISLVRYTQSPQRTDALHLVELEKSLVNANYGVRNLLQVPDRFMIGRAFSKYGQVFNLSPQSLSLRVEYDNGTQEKLYEHFVQHLRRVNISNNGVMVMM